MCAMNNHVDTGLKMIDWEDFFEVLIVEVARLIHPLTELGR